jgi:adhesin transport system membrane fusion protein
MADKKKPVKKEPVKELKLKVDEKQAAPNLNSAKDWDVLHKASSSISRSMSKVEAYGDKMLVTDEDLPLARHLQFFFIIGIILSFIIWANFAKLDEITRGQGKVVPSSEVQIIQHQEGGTVQELLVKEGDTVDTGQILMRLSDVGASSELGSVRARMMGLQAKVMRLQAEAEGQAVLEFDDEMIAAIPQTVQEELSSQRRQEVSEINTRLADLNRVISLTREEMAMIKPLVDRGSAPKRDVLQLEQQLAQQQSEINGLRSSLPRARSAISEAEARLKDIETTFRTTAQNDMTSALIDVKALEQQMPALQDRKSRTDIRSPVRGIVKDIRIQTSDGSGVIKPGDAIMEIVPLDDQLVVEAQIKPSDVAFLHPGQEATVKITAYDFSIYGGLKGELTGISADTITDEKGESFYKIRITTNENTITRNGENLPIIPGMVASVDILTGEKTVMEYIMKPLIKSLSQAMNER